MIEKWKYWILKNKEQINAILNLSLGLLMLTALLIFGKTGNKLSMYIIIFSGALMTISNGYRLLWKKNTKTMGQSMILFGIVILFLGMMVVLI